MFDDLYQLHQQFQQAGIVFAFNGPVSHRVIEGIGETLKKKLEHEDAGMNTIQRVFSVFVEQMQNVVNYSAESVAQPENLEGELRIGTLVVGRDEKHFWVQCGNLVRTEQTPGLRNRLDYIRSLNPEQLNSLYRERQNTSTGGGSKGAGLGFIDIARTASRPVEYSFVSAGHGMAFFTIKAIISEQT